MKISFRQGIIRYQKDKAGNQTFLQRASVGNAINLMAITDPTVVTIAQRRNNYIIEERVSVPNAWTNFTAGIDYWLYIDVDMITGQRSFGSSTFAPTYGPIAPSAPQLGQHWFDTNSLVMCMKVYNGTNFAEVLRVFVAKYQQGATIIPMAIGSQIANNTPSDAGTILFDSEGNPVRKMLSRTQNEFFTTASIFSSTSSKSINVTLDALCTTVTAKEPLPAFSLVCHDEVGLIKLADCSTHDRVAVGIVQEDFYRDETGIYTAQGYVYNEAWNWTDAPGTPVFLGNNGAVVVTPSQYHTIQQVGEIVSPTQIRLDLGPSLQYDSITTDYKNLVPVALDKTTGQYIVTSVDIADEASDKKPGYLHLQNSLATKWTVNHRRGSFRYLIQLFDETGSVIMPDAIKTIDGNNIEVTFIRAQAGHAAVVFFDPEIQQVNYDISLSATSSFNSDEVLLIQPMPTNAILPATATGCKAVTKTSADSELLIKVDGATVGTIVFTAGSNIGTFVIPQDVTITEQQVLEVTASPNPSTLANVGVLIRLQNTGTN